MPEQINIPITADIQGLISQITDLQNQFMQLKQRTDDMNTALTNLNANKPQLSQPLKEADGYVEGLNKSLRENINLWATATDPKAKQQYANEIREINVELQKIRDVGKLGLEKVNEEAKKGSTLFGQLKKTIGAAFSIYAIYSFAKSATETYEHILKQEMKLKGALGDRIYLYDEMVSMATDLKNATGIDKADILDAESYLAVQGRTEAQMKQITKAALDMSVVLGVGVFQATKMLDSTLEGSKGRLGRYSKVVREMTTEELMAGDAIDVLGKKYEGLAEKSRTSSEQLSQAWKTVKEGVGYTLVDTWEGAKTFGLTVGQVFKTAFSGSGDLVNNLDELKKKFDELGDSKWANLTFLGLPKIASEVIDGLDIFPKQYGDASEAFGSFASQYLDTQDKIDEALKKGEKAVSSYFFAWYNSKADAITQKSLQNQYEYYMKGYQALVKYKEAFLDQKATEKETADNKQKLTDIKTMNITQLETEIKRIEELDDADSETNQKLLKNAQKRLKTLKEEEQEYKDYITKIQNAAYALLQYEIDLMEEGTAKQLAEENLRYKKEVDKNKEEFQLLSNYNDITESAEKSHQKKLADIKIKAQDETARKLGDARLQAMDDEFEKQQLQDEVELEETKYTERQKLIFEVRAADKAYEYAVKRGKDELAAKKELLEKIKALNKDEIEFNKSYNNELTKIKIASMADGYDKELAAETQRHTEAVEKIRTTYNNDPVMIAAELDLYNANMDKLKQKRSIWELLGLKGEKAEAAEVIASALGDILSSYTSYVDKLVQLRQQEVSNLEDNIAKTREALNTELELHKQGFASNVQAKQKELAALEQARKEALVSQRKALAEQRQIDAISQSISLATAVASIVKQFTSKAGIIGAFAGLALGASLVASFLTTKNTIAGQIEGSYGEGGIVGRRLKGRSHRQGGIHIIAEGDEWMVNKNASRKYNNVLSNINADKPRQALLELASLNGIDMTVHNELSDKRDTLTHIVSLNEIKEIREIRDFMLNGTHTIHGNGYRIERSGNTERIIHETKK